MRFYNTNHKQYCGIDLHARSMYLCVLSHDGKTLLHKNLPTDPDVFLNAIAPFREDRSVSTILRHPWAAFSELRLVSLGR